MLVSKEVWVCLVRGRAYANPKDTAEYFCFGIANGVTFMKHDHSEAGCGLYVQSKR